MTGSSGLVVVGVDDSPTGRAALRFALEDAARRGARVDVVSAFRLPEYGWGVDPRAIAGTLDRAVSDIHHAVRDHVRGVADEVLAEIADGAVAPPPVTVFAVGGNAGEALVHAARTADLLVVGSRGRGVLASAVLGSVSLYCVLNARCPVTVVHPAADREPASAAG
jgi:nucleotide-binding universal stress UspA family protein